MQGPGAEEERLAKLWWSNFPDHLKWKLSIWTILALYAEYVLKTRTVGFASDEKTAEV